MRTSEGIRRKRKRLTSWHVEPRCQTAQRTGGIPPFWEKGARSVETVSIRPSTELQKRKGEGRLGRTGIRARRSPFSTKFSAPKGRFFARATSSTSQLRYS